MSHFETVLNSKKLQMTTEMLLLKKNIVGKGETANFEQFHFFPQYFSTTFFFNAGQYLKLFTMP